MAAQMHRVLRLSFIRCDFPKVAWGKDVFLHSIGSRGLATNSESSKSSDPVPEDSVKVLHESPNQTQSLGYKISSLHQAFERSRSSSSEAKETGLSFATLFRRSNFAHLGNARGKAVIGTIYRVVGDDLYIDFGWKFPCVVKRPEEDAHMFVNHATVRLRIIDLEMSTIFLGATKETSLNEANCALIGLISSPLKPQIKTLHFEF